MEIKMKVFQDVREFHLAFGHPAPEKPTMQEPAFTQRRAGWLEEEARELREATTLAEQADAYIDAMYFALGGLVELGLDPQPIWDLVHGANMAKLWPDGLAHKTPEGKVIKPEGWTPPDAAIAEEIERQIAL